MARRVGLVVAGAGARGAYEAGALAGLLPRMQAHGSLPTVLAGTSAGALNVVGLAGFAHLDIQDATDRLRAAWEAVSLDDVFNVGSALETGLKYVGQIAGLPTRLTSLLDTERLRGHLLDLLPLDTLHENIASGLVDAVAVTTTSVATGGTVVFLEKHPSVPMPSDDVGRNITYVETRIGVEHVMASAAVPMLFRPVRINEPERWRGWYVDGGLRLNTPLKPAVDLGCGRLGVVATQPMTTQTSPPPAVHTPVEGEPPVEQAHPPDVYGVAAMMLRVLLADRMIEDMHRLARRNVHAGGHTAPGHIDFLFAGPSLAERGDIAALADRIFHERYSGARGIFHPALWSLARLIGGDPDDHGNLLSYLFFDPAFTGAAAELGLAHARDQIAELPPPH